MTAEFGQLALGLALGASLAQALFLTWGARRADAAWMAAGRHAAAVHGVLALAAFGALEAAFLAGDFSVAAVARSVDADLPAAYRASAAWSVHEGAMLLWAALLAAWTLALRFGSRRLPLELACRALGVLGLVSSAFLAFVIAAANPFARLVPFPAEGRGLDPALQDPLAAVQAPLFYLGCTGLAVVFALAAAALAERRLDAAWARGSRPWALLAWCALTLSLVTSAAWAWREPGLDGAWSWDPAQVAGLLPWFAGAALLHSLAVAEKRGLLRRWTAFLAMLAFPVAILAAFLVRSGVLSSAHVLALDARPGGGLMWIAAVACAAALAFVARSAGAHEGRGSFELVSRESAIVAATAVFLAALGAVLLGTLYPLLAGAPGRPAAPMGDSYFTPVVATLLLPGVVLLGAGPRLRWGGEDAREALRDALGPALAAVAVAGAAVLAVPRAPAWVALGAALSAWIAWHVVEAVAYRWRRDARPSGREEARAPASFYATHLAHLGAALLVAGIAISGGLGHSAEVVLLPGMPEPAGGVRLRAEGAQAARGPNFEALRVRISVHAEGRTRILEPEWRQYRAGTPPRSRPAADLAWAEAIQVRLSAPVGGGAWAVRVRRSPFPGLALGGGLLMVAGAVTGALDRRYRARLREREEEREVLLALAREGAP